MKLYLVKSKNYKTSIMALEPWDSMDFSVEPMAIRAFIKKKYAQQYIKAFSKYKQDCLEIISIALN